MYSPFAPSADPYLAAPPFHHNPHHLHHHHHHHHLHLHHHNMMHAGLAPAIPFMMPAAAPIHTPAARTLRATPGDTPSRTMPMHWSGQHQQHASSSSKKNTVTTLSAGGLTTERSSEKPAAAVASTMHPDKVGKGLERDLNNATPEELVQILLDLSCCNAQAAAFINTKAQLFALRRPSSSAVTSAGLYHDHLQDDFHRTGVTMTPASDKASVRETPSKALVLDDSCGAVSPVAAMRSPLQTLQTTLQHRHDASETRAFAAEMHPCLRMYGACRHSTNCPYKTLPKNVCIHWIRNSCSSTSECPAVHRLPSDCPVQVTMVFDLSRGMDRTAMSRKAQSLMLTSEPWMGEDVVVRPSMDEIDPSQCITPRNQGTWAEPPRSAVEHVVEEQGEEVDCARCLNDSLENAAASS